MSVSRPGCEARFDGGSMRCDRCGLLWDHDDPEPPECVTPEMIQRQRGREALNTIKRIVDDIPDVEPLPWFLQEQAE